MTKFDLNKRVLGVVFLFNARSNLHITLAWEREMCLIFPQKRHIGIRIVRSVALCWLIKYWCYNTLTEGLNLWSQGFTSNSKKIELIFYIYEIKCSIWLVSSALECWSPKNNHILKSCLVQYSSALDGKLTTNYVYIHIYIYIYIF